jgi:3-hexulose-6-phosphate synthase
MELQVALDRLALDDAVRIATQVAPHADRIEVGTSLIKEFGVSSIRRLRRAVPDRHLVADVKTFDNAHYEFELCFDAGADAATVLGAAPDATVRMCVDVARAHRRQVLIDLLATSSRRQADLLVHHDAVFGIHIGKDDQEAQPGAGGSPRCCLAGQPTGASPSPVGSAWTTSPPLVSRDHS